MTVTKSPGEIPKGDFFRDGAGIEGLGDVLNVQHLLHRLSRLEELPLDEGKGQRYSD